MANLPLFHWRLSSSLLFHSKMLTFSFKVVNFAAFNRICLVHHFSIPKWLAPNFSSKSSEMANSSLKCVNFATFNQNCIACHIFIRNIRALVTFLLKNGELANFSFKSGKCAFFIQFSSLPLFHSRLSCSLLVLSKVASSRRFH